MPGKAKVNGPYQHGKRWRVILYAGTRQEGYRSFDSEREAREFVATFREEADEHSIGQAVAAYVDHLARYGGSKARRPLRPSTVVSTRYRLIAYFQLPMKDRPLATLSPTYVETLYREQIKRGVRVDTHRGQLAVTVAFLNWCVDQEWLRSNPAASVRPEGERSFGKTVLRVDDARKFLHTALADASDSGLACAILLVLGLRCSELTERLVGDINIEPVLLNVPKGKSRAARRLLRVPAPLSQRLIAHVSGRDRSDRLFRFTRYALHYHVERICKLAEVPIVCPHGLRGSAATNALELGGDLSKLVPAMGHETKNVTERHYIAPGVIESSEAAAKVALLMGDAGNDLETVGQNPFPELNSDVWN